MEPDRLWGEGGGQPGDHMLNVVAEDKSLRLRWYVDAARRLGEDAPSVPRVSPRRGAAFTLPEFTQPPSDITPGLVRRLIEEALHLLAAPPSNE